MSQNVNSVINHMNYMDAIFELKELAERIDYTKANELYHYLSIPVKKKACDYPDEIGVLKFNDGTYEVYPDCPDTPPAVKYIREGY